MALEKRVKYPFSQCCCSNQIWIPQPLLEIDFKRSRDPITGLLVSHSSVTYNSSKLDIFFWSFRNIFSRNDTVPQCNC